MQRARQAGVVQQVLTGTSVAGSRKALQLAQQFPGELFATAGLHPHHASECDAEAVDSFRQCAQQPEIVAIGECGLDFFRNFSPRADQEQAFVAQLELAAELQLPVFLHERDAHDAFLSIVGEYRDRLSGAVAHCFTGNPEQLRRYLDLDLHIGITGWLCDERRGHDLRDAAPLIPVQRLMIETDAPYLQPRNLRPRPKTRRNEPANLAHILNELATLRGDDPARLARDITDTSRQFFALPGANAVLRQA